MARSLWLPVQEVDWERSDIIPQNPLIEVIY